MIENPFEVILARLSILDTKFSDFTQSLNIKTEVFKERILKTREETKAHYHISDPTLNRRVAEGKIDKIYMGRRVLYDLTDLLSVPNKAGL